MRNFNTFSEFEKSALRALDTIMRDMQARPGAYIHTCFTSDDLASLIESAHRGDSFRLPERQIYNQVESFAAGIQEANERAEQILAIEEVKTFKSTVRFEQLYKRIEKAYRTNANHYQSLMDAATCSVTDEQWDEIVHRLDALRTKAS